MKLMKDKGIQIIEFSDKERAAIAADIRANVWPALAKNMGKEFLDQVLKMMN